MVCVWGGGGGAGDMGQEALALNLQIFRNIVFTNNHTP